MTSLTITACVVSLFSSCGCFCTYYCSLRVAWGRGLTTRAYELEVYYYTPNPLRKNDTVALQTSPIWVCISHALQVKEYSQESSAFSSCGLDVRKDEWGRRCHREVTWRTGFRSKRVTKGIVITRVEAIGGSLNWAMLLWLKTGSWHLGKTTEQVHNFLLFP